MKVKYTKTTREKLPQLSVQNGQIIYLTDSSGVFYDMNNVRYTVSSIEQVNGLPQVGYTNIMYVDVSANPYVAYLWNDLSQTFVPLTGSTGHLILNYLDQQLTARAKLKFDDGFAVVDDSVNHQTIVAPCGLVEGDMEDIMDPPPIYGAGPKGHIIMDRDDFELAQRARLKFGNGFDVDDDSSEIETVVTPTGLAEGDMEDIIDPLPSALPKYHLYKTTEQVIGKWLDNRLIYEKTFTFFEDIQLESNVWQNGKIPNTGMHTIIDAKGFYTEACYPLYAKVNSEGSNVMILQTRNSAILLNAITLQYTKLSDE